MGFHLVLRGFTSSEIVVVKDHTIEVLEFKTMSIWIINKNMLGLWTLEGSIFA
jgi:hypothetical protein